MSGKIIRISAKLVSDREPFVMSFSADGKQCQGIVKNTVQGREKITPSAIGESFYMVHVEEREPRKWEITEIICPD
ncbi:MAG: hypothetical protein UW89_C0015G0001 [Parcubacteria group bacterium GW2011_GWB1_45_10]|nr:MAG: hypothetical protein UW89_C0015G0001 [Parcubacteria group bacterium GW2011_GWB1_45_10]